MSRVLLITTEPLPLQGWPTTGAGLRAWGLAQGLRSRGHEVTLLMPEDAAAGFAPAKNTKPPTRDFPDWIGVYNRDRLADDARVETSDVVVLQHWGVARNLGDLHVPLAIDLAGPHLLERRLWGSPSSEADLMEKLDALRRADFVTASGRDQRLYFLPYLAMAGWNISSAENPIPVIPFSLQPDPQPAPIRPDRFIYGGFFLPWQDPSKTLEITLDELSTAGRGELVFIGGAHPRIDVSRGRFDALVEKLKSHPSVRFIEPLGYDDYVSLLREGGVALDLMQCNAERELAFTTRTVQFMACGLPVIHNNYSELGRIIQERNAGWALDPDDHESIRRILRGLLSGEIDPTPQSRAARTLVAEKLNWEKTISPLDEFCRNPIPRNEKTASTLAFESRARRIAVLESELAGTNAELRTLEGKRWVRWGLKLSSNRGWLTWPAATLSLLLGIVLIPVFWINDRHKS